MEDLKNVTKQSSPINQAVSTPKVEELKENSLVQVNGGIGTKFTRTVRLPSNPAKASNSNDPK